jgi:hypothetical protein
MEINNLMIINSSLLLVSLIIFFFKGSENEVKDHFKKVDQVLWVVKDIEMVIAKWTNLGFTQVIEFGQVDAKCRKSGKKVKIKLAKANLGGANITWIQSIDTNSVFSDFHDEYGETAMSIIHRLESSESLDHEIDRLESLGVSILEDISVVTEQGICHYVLMNTKMEGKYILGYTYGTDDLKIIQELTADNRHSMQLNQYAFAIKEAESVSQYWQKFGFPALDLRIPELNDKVYYGKPANYDLKQGWQKHGTIDYEWCIPVKSPTVYEDHIKKHGEGIHHLAFKVDDIHEVFRDYKSKGFVISMAGTWGEKDKPGSGIFAYVDLESAGGLSLELLWNYKESR